MSPWFGTGWTAVAGVVLSTLVMYFATVAFVRIAGRRTIAELSAFDAVVTIALGSIVATTIVSPSPTVPQGVAAVAALLTLQVLTAWLRKRFRLLRRILEFSPEVVVRQGRLTLPEGVLTSQLTEEELHSRLRQAGVGSPEDASLVLLEPTGGISVLRRGDAPAVLFATQEQRSR